MKRFLLLALFARSCGSAFAAERPNIVILFIDDLGYGDIGPFGATKQRTPNLDRMASEGMKLYELLRGTRLLGVTGAIAHGLRRCRISVPASIRPGVPTA